MVSDERGVCVMKRQVVLWMLLSCGAATNCFGGLESIAQQSEEDLIQRACGPKETHFVVKMDKSASVSAVSNNPLLAHLILLPEAVGAIGRCRYLTTRVGLDGKWIGATCQGGSFTAHKTLGKARS